MNKEKYILSNLCKILKVKDSQYKYKNLKQFITAMYASLFESNNQELINYIEKRRTKEQKTAHFLLDETDKLGFAKDHISSVLNSKIKEAIKRLGFSETRRMSEKEEIIESTYKDLLDESREIIKIPGDLNSQ